MSRAILLVGFNNWGKTRHINHLFKEKFEGARFDYGRTYTIRGITTSFVVETHSNDDFNEQEYIETLQKRIDRCPGKDLFGALCPTRGAHQLNNGSRSILTKLLPSRFNAIYLFYLRFKWDHHAELRIKEIQQYFQGINNAHHFVIDADEHAEGEQRFTERENQIRGRLRQLYP